MYIYLYVYIYDLNAGFSDANLRRDLRIMQEKFDTLALLTTTPSAHTNQCLEEMYLVLIARTSVKTQLYIFDTPFQTPENDDTAVERLRGILFVYNGYCRKPSSNSLYQ